jgi:hypothetical protein
MVQYTYSQVIPLNQKANMKRSLVQQEDDTGSGVHLHDKFELAERIIFLERQDMYSPFIVFDPMAGKRGMEIASFFVNWFKKGERPSEFDHKTHMIILYLDVLASASNKNETGVAKRYKSMIKAGVTGFPEDLTADDMVGWTYADQDEFPLAGVVCIYNTEY